MNHKDNLKIVGWLFIFLACLIPIYMDWAVQNGPEWLSEENAMTSGIFMALLFLWTGSRFLKDKRDDDNDNSGLW